MEFTRQVQAADYWIARLVKLAPAEATSCFFFAVNMITDPAYYWALLIAFLVLVAATFFYYRFLQLTCLQMAIMTLAFVFWAVIVAKDPIATAFYTYGFEATAEAFLTRLPEVFSAVYLAVVALVFPNTLASIQAILGHKKT